jgi:hypothetical protein
MELISEIGGPLKNSALLRLVSVAFAQAQTVLIASNNKAANDIRKQLSIESQKGKRVLPYPDGRSCSVRTPHVNGAPASGVRCL